MDRIPLKYFLIMALLSLSTSAFNQSIGYNQVIYVPQSESALHTQLPKTPAIKDFTKKLRSQIKGEIKGLKKKDENYDLKKQEILKEYCFGEEGSLRAIYAVESLKVMSEKEAVKSLFHFLKCWEEKNFKSRKKNFCMGCWEQHIERERYYKERLATIY